MSQQETSSTPGGPVSHVDASGGPGPTIIISSTPASSNPGPTSTTSPSVLPVVVPPSSPTIPIASTSSSSSAYPPTLDAVLSEITSSAHKPAILSQTLKGALPRESRDAILAGILPGGQDPLGALDVRLNTLGVLWILSARLTVHDAAPPPPQYILDFCRHFEPEQARLAPDRMTLLARGIVRYADRLNNDTWAIEPLYLLLTRYPPDTSYLTTIHPIFILPSHPQTPIIHIDASLSDLSYLDNLKYHYIGGVALAALGRWEEAEQLLEMCVGSPATVPSAIQMEALKKLRLVQLIYKGKTSSLPRYVHQGLLRLLKSTPYHAFINAYPHNMDQLQSVIDEHRQLFSLEKNLGLVMQAFRRAPRWMLKKLTSTYLTLSLADIAREIKIGSLADVRNLLLSMIEAKDVSARISADGTVTFFDSKPHFSKQDVDRLLQDVQRQSENLRHLERELGKDKEFIKKALKQKDDPMWASALEDDLFSAGPGPGGSSQTWTDDAMFS